MKGSEEFRRGDEAPDVKDGDWVAFVGDPRLRHVIRAADISTIEGLEVAADEIDEHDATTMGVPYRRAPHLNEIVAAYEREMGS